MKEKKVMSLAFHAEKLHDERVWRRVKKIADWMAYRNSKATFFVYPFRAQVEGKDISDKVRYLGALGHEIGQHTHFYAGAQIDKHSKVDDLSDANIRCCVQRDYETLRHMDIMPRGFTAGAWVVNEVVWDTLIDMEVVYDCSARFPKPKVAAPFPYHRWARSPQIFTNAKGSLLVLPTLCSLGEWFKWGRKMHLDGATSYQLVYLHDYDLLSFPHCVLIHIVLALGVREGLVTAGFVAESLTRRRELDD